MNKPKFIMLVGLPASGKSTKAKEIAEIENATILSSDELRVELYGDVNHQDNNGELFVELYRRAKEKLKSGISVIIDATNINSKRRIAAIQEFKQYQCEVYYFSTGYEDCIQNDHNRNRKVGIDVIDRMYKNLTIPTKSEGWDCVHIVSDEYELMNSNRKYFENIISNLMSHDDLFDELNFYDSWTFKKILNLPHDSKWHTLSVSRHTYEVWKYVMENYQEEDKNKMLLVALFHDTGKSFCKSFKEGSRYANFISHENVSAQLTCRFLCWLGYDKDYILEICELVQLHMRLLGISMGDDGEKARNKLIDFIGEDKFNKLKFFREADEQAH